MQFLNNSKDTEEIIVRRIMRRLDRHFGELESNLQLEAKHSSDEPGQFDLDESEATQIGRAPVEQILTRNVTPPPEEVFAPVPLNVLPQHETFLELIDASETPIEPKTPTSVVAKKTVLSAKPLITPPPPPVPQRQTLPSVPLPTRQNHKARAGVPKREQELGEHHSRSDLDPQQTPQSGVSDSPTIQLFPASPQKPQTILGMRPSFLIVFLLMILGFFVAYYFLVGNEFVY